MTIINHLLKKRYLKKGETKKQMFLRVAKEIAKVEKNIVKRKKLEKEFYHVMVKNDFLPNSPTLMNAGTEIGQLSACFVLPIEDSIESIFNTLKEMALIHQSGGGTGFSFSRIRPKGDIVKKSHGVASGPVSFLTIYDRATEIIKQGGKRRGANIGILSVAHPDIFEFIDIKRHYPLNNFNLSVAVTDNFLKAVENNKIFFLINPRNKKIVKKVRARKIFNKIVDAAWQIGDPGLIFIDEINRKHPLKQKIESTNPCGEATLLPYESCNLGSINLANMVNDRNIDWKKLKKTVNIAINFLDNVIDANKCPMEIIEKTTKANRKIGLGVMGFAEMLIKLGISYNSKKAVNFAENLMKFISEKARKKSEELGKEKGNFPNLKKSKIKSRYMRNATVTTIAPTGTLSILANTSPGIEPLFGLCYMREVMGKKYYHFNKLLLDYLKSERLLRQNIINKIKKQGNLKGINEIPNKIKKLFLTSLEIKPDQHIKIQAAFQKYCDNAVSKTVNLPENATKSQTKKIFVLAYKLKCKGITVYRDKSKKGQIITCITC